MYRTNSCPKVDEILFHPIISLAFDRVGRLLHVFKIYEDSGAPTPAYALPMRLLKRRFWGEPTKSGIPTRKIDFAVRAVVVNGCNVHHLL
jgi:hypothetical protein